MEKISAVKDFLTCPVCLDTFKEPVSLTCHHSFCSNCLQEYWDQNSTRNCPVCRRKSSKEHLDVNFALKELTVSFSQKEEAPGGERPVVCTSHPEQTPLFCLDENRPLCPLCEFSLHSGHKVVTVDSAVREKKEQLVSQLQSLFQRRKKASNKQTQCEQIQELAHAQVEACERRIKAEFELLHRFLQQEEESALRALRQEQSRQTQTIEAQMVQIREELCTVEQNLLTVEDLLKKQNMDFLTQYRDTHKDRQTLLSQPSPQLRPGLLINQPKVLANVAFNAWKKMRALVQYSPVILDPNTADSRLYVSEDLRGVTFGETKQQQVPHNPERFCNYTEVQGSEGFSSGSHQWDVEVGDHPDWTIGLAKESVDKKGERDGLPEDGLWCLDLADEEYYDVVGKTLVLKRSPQRIRVRLDCDKGTVSFFDAGDMSLICSHKDRFTEKMFPYFYVGESGDAETKEIKIYSSKGQI
uniref:Uncharacterized protein n=1 Tax=Periophthalmus magnuspinnatus TaxID=409849 RepID=A0A3B4BHQ1_9GOBI